MHIPVVRTAAFGRALRRLPYESDAQRTKRASCRPYFVLNKEKLSRSWRGDDPANTGDARRLRPADD
jgi:hypothetical protein